MRSYSRSTTVRTNHDRETRSCEPFEDSCGTACTGFTVRRISDHLVRRDEKVYVQLQVFAVRDIRYIRQYGNTAIRYSVPRRPHKVCVRECISAWFFAILILALRASFLLDLYGYIRV